MKRKKAIIEKQKAINDINEKIIDLMDRMAKAKVSESALLLALQLKLSALIIHKAEIQAQPTQPKIDCIKGKKDLCDVAKALGNIPKLGFSPKKISKITEKGFKGIREALDDMKKDEDNFKIEALEAQNRVLKKTNRILSREIQKFLPKE